MKNRRKLCILTVVALTAVSAFASAALAQTQVLVEEPAYSYEMLEYAIKTNKSTEPDSSETENTETRNKKSKSKKKKAAKEKTVSYGVIDTLPQSDTVAITASVALSGSGTGYHAKLVIGTADAAVSFGLQFDEYAVYPYAGCTAFLVENVLSEWEQQYTRFEYQGSPYASLYAPYDLTLAVTPGTGEVSVYVFDELVGSVVNPNLIGQQLYAWVEGAARKNGDYVTAEFENVRVLENGKLYNNPQVSFVQLADGIYSDIMVDSRPSSIIVSGALQSLDYRYDWDSAPTSVNGYVRFY